MGEFYMVYIQDHTGKKKDSPREMYVKRKITS